MAVCTVESGVLFWKKPCGDVALGHCGNCGRVVCKKHFLRQPDGPFLCPGCAPHEQDSDSGSWFSWGPSSGAAAAAAASDAGAVESSGGESSGGGDSGGGDSGGSDSGGGGDSGGSSSD